MGNAFKMDFHGDGTSSALFSFKHKDLLLHL